MASVMVGQQIQLDATVRDAAGAVLTGRPVTWTSSNNAVATVNAAGLVKALALGPAAITATSEGQSGVATLMATTGLTFTSVSAGSRHTCGLTPSGAGYCWGDNSSGQLGDGTITSTATPAIVSGGLNFATVSAGEKHTCGVTANGVVYCWGDNRSGQLGNGTTTSSAIPTVVAGDLPVVVVSAGGRHTCAVSGSALYIGSQFINAGTVYCWGENSSGPDRRWYLGQYLGPGAGLDHTPSPFDGLDK